MNTHNNYHLCTKASLTVYSGAALLVFALIIVFASNAYSWGWSRSPGQATPSASSTDETTDISSEQSNQDSVVSEAPSQDTDISETANSDQNISETSGSYEPVVNNFEDSDPVHAQSGSQPVWKKRAKRKNLLVKKWRSEKSRKDVFHVTTDQPLNIPDVKFQLDRIQAEIPIHPENQLPYKGSDLALLEEWINDAMDRRIPAQSRSKISKSINSVSSVWNNTDVLKKIDSLERKRDMLVYGNNALQAMGIFVD